MSSGDAMPTESARDRIKAEIRGLIRDDTNERHKAEIIRLRADNRLLALALVGVQVDEETAQAMRRAMEAGADQMKQPADAQG